MSLFRSTPSLTRLGLTGMDFPVGFFQMFAQSTTTRAANDSNSNEDTALLPYLRGLVLSGCEGIEWSAISLLLVDRPLFLLSGPTEVERVETVPWVVEKVWQSCNEWPDSVYK